MDRLYNCPNCGAPITGPKCEYCGTVFEHKPNEESVKIGCTTKELEKALDNFVKVIRGEK